MYRYMFMYLFYDYPIEMHFKLSETKFQIFFQYLGLVKWINVDCEINSS